jgi:hypothetical protein
MFWGQKRSSWTSKIDEKVTSCRYVCVKAFGQIKTTSCHIMVLTSYFQQLRNYLYNGNLWGRSRKSYWAYNRLQAPHYSLGGYSHRERWMRTQWPINSKRKWVMKYILQVALQDWRRRIFDYSLRGYSHQERWSRTRWRWKYRLQCRSKNRLHHRWQTPDNKLAVSLPSGGIRD